MPLTDACACVPEAIAGGACGLLLPLYLLPGAAGLVPLEAGWAGHEVQVLSTGPWKPPCPGADDKDISGKGRSQLFLWRMWDSAGWGGGHVRGEVNKEPGLWLQGPCWLLPLLLRS